MTEPLEPSEGLGVLHLFCAVGPATEAEAVRTAVKAGEEAGLQVVPFAVLGHKADLGFMAVGADLWRLRALQTDLVAAGLELRDSYVSLTELSEYSAGVPDQKTDRLASFHTSKNQWSRTSSRPYRSTRWAVSARTSAPQASQSFGGEMVPP